MKIEGRNSYLGTTTKRMREFTCFGVNRKGREGKGREGKGMEGKGKGRGGGKGGWKGREGNDRYGHRYRQMVTPFSRR